MERRRSSSSFVAAVIAVLGVVPWAVGCGKSATASADGGDGAVIIPDAPVTPDAPVSGRVSFDVVAVLRGDGGVGATSLPQTNSFTLVIDAAAQRAIAGGNGRGAVVGVTSSDGRTFRSSGPFSVGSGDGSPCSSVPQVRYESFEVTIAGGTLTGTATGAAEISCGDCFFNVPFGATLTGTADATAPTLRSSGIKPGNPFDWIGLLASEPLPAGAKARLVADDGESIDLIPSVIDGAEPLVMGFTKRDVVLRAGQGYAVAFDGLVDFAGLTDRSGIPLRVVSFAAAPVVPEDGFESAAGGELGGALVMNGGALPAITGNTSLYIGGMGAPAVNAANGRTLSLRLSRQPGDTKVRFAYRVVAPHRQGYFAGMVRVGSEGASAGSPALQVSGTAATEAITLAGQPAYASVVTVSETALPADTKDEVLIVIGPHGVSCGLPPPSNVGLLIDDLRLE